MRGSSVDLAASFNGRQEEIDWLADRIMRHRQLAPIVVNGVGGIGKTTLLRIFFSQVAGVEPAWLTLDRASDAMNEACSFVEAL
ncbi:MAG: hypothetical protein JHC52_09475, partial [Chthoniobacterales bacterium]|nr:hypothetical protein [Chthoniobacterales bacterium]